MRKYKITCDICGKKIKDTMGYLGIYKNEKGNNGAKHLIINDVCTSCINFIFIEFHRMKNECKEL